MPCVLHRCSAVARRHCGSLKVRARGPSCLRCMCRQTSSSVGAGKGMVAHQQMTQHGAYLMRRNHVLVLAGHPCEGSRTMRSAQQSVQGPCAQMCPNAWQTATRVDKVFATRSMEASALAADLGLGAGTLVVRVSAMQLWVLCRVEVRGLQATAVTTRNIVLGECTLFAPCVSRERVLFQ